MTVPFVTVFEDENPKKMKKEIRKQEKEDPTNPENILSILNKQKKKSLKKLASSSSMPCIKPEDDISPTSLSVQFGQDVGQLYADLEMPLLDIETGEDIRPQFFTTYREIANVTYQTGILSRIDPRTRDAFIRRVRNVDGINNN